MTIPAVPLICGKLRAEEREQFDICGVAERAGDHALIAFSLFVDTLGRCRISKPRVVLRVIVGHGV